MKPATPQQLKAIHALLHAQGLLRHKAEMIDGITNGRSSSSKDLTFEEAAGLLAHLTAGQESQQQNTAMVKKFFAMCFEMGWIPEVATVNEQGRVLVKKDYSRVNGWLMTYGYLKKPLNEYSYNELPKLLTQFEKGPYNHYISNLSKEKNQNL